MRKIISFQIPILLMLSHLALAFESEKCSEMRRGKDMFGLTSSLVSFTTSTGDCAAITLKEHRELFIVENKDFLEEDLARKNGEHLDTLVYLSGCNSSQSPLLKQRLFSESRNNWINENYPTQIERIITSTCSGG